MLRDASSALEMMEMERSLKASQSHTLNHFLTRDIAQRASHLGSRRERTRGVNALGCVCPVFGQQQIRGRCGVINTTPPKLVIIVQHHYLSVLLTSCRYYRRLPEMQQRSLIGSTDLGPKLPRVEKTLTETSYTHADRGWYRGGQVRWEGEKRNK
jgi:hypothetical protein